MEKLFWMILASCLALGAFGCGDGDGSQNDGGTDTDSDGGSDGDTDSDTDADSDACSGDGLWYDEASGLCWQEPPPEGAMAWSDAVSYCDGLEQGGRTDWRLPNIDELISLLRGCQDATATGDSSPSLCETTPDGCAATDSCENINTCNPCADFSGPGEDGGYLDPALTGEWGWHWSSSSYVGDVTIDWAVDFVDGYANGFLKAPATGNTRCVRGGA